MLTHKQKNIKTTAQESILDNPAIPSASRLFYISLNIALLEWPQEINICYLHTGWKNIAIYYPSAANTIQIPKQIYSNIVQLFVK